MSFFHTTNQTNGQRERVTLATPLKDTLDLIILDWIYLRKGEGVMKWLRFGCITARTAILREEGNRLPEKQGKRGSFHRVLSNGVGTPANFCSYPNLQ